MGFKYISSKMTETGAILGGESSAGLTVAGHINGKDGVYAASLLVEMVAVTGKKLSELMEMISEECGNTYMEERAYSFSEKVKMELQERLFVEKELPEMKPFEVDHVSYMDARCSLRTGLGNCQIFRNGATLTNLL